MLARTVDALQSTMTIHDAPTLANPTRLVTPGPEHCCEVRYVPGRDGAEASGVTSRWTTPNHCGGADVIHEGVDDDTETLQHSVDDGAVRLKDVPTGGDDVRAAAQQVTVEHRARRPIDDESGRGGIRAAVQPVDDVLCGLRPDGD